ncbi:MAG: LodA/GoxA family CTQ-dependent oxidase, partial [Flavobacteriales bacterium]|nr:LodA/GoxA family CTQ-dependent oxidase [Flavobacteriales bacterium]
MEKNKISHVAIYPPIGIARIGNSPEYFLASEVPGVAPKPAGGYKDLDGRVKKQAVQFRIYAFDDAGNVLGEITDKEGKIEWNIDVANVKAAWYQFNNALDLPGSSIPSAPRNPKVVGDDREHLAITPTPVSISGKSTSGKEYYFDDGKFYDKPVNLGHVKTDGEGRLIFVPADGDSESKNNKPAITFANNNGWHDDTCDGVIRATVKIGNISYDATPAMVAVTPPNFAPGLFGVVTMNDVVQNLFVNEMEYPNPSENGVVFWEHIFPILERMTGTQWVNQGFFMLFGKNSPSDFTNPELIKILEDPSNLTIKARERVFNWFRDPESREYTPAKVPPFYG